MNKTVFLTAFVLLFVGISLQAMDSAAPAAAPATGTVAKICSKCPLKSAFVKAFSWCKAHPIYIAAGVSAAALVAVYFTCPFIKTKVRECLGLEEAQKEAVKFDPCFVCTEEKEVQKNDVDLDPLSQI